MEATTMDAAGSSVPPAAKTEETAAGKSAGVLLGALQGVWWFSLGTLAVAGEQTGRLVNLLVQRGKEAEPSLRGPLKKAEGGVTTALSDAGTQLKKLGKSLGRGAGKVEGVLDERVAALLAQREAPLRQEMQDLAKKVEDLTGKLEQLQTRREKAEKAEKPAR